MTASAGIFSLLGRRWVLLWDQRWLLIQPSRWEGIRLMKTRRPSPPHSLMCLRGYLYGKVVAKLPCIHVTARVHPIWVFFFFCLDGDFSDGVLITYNLTMGSTCGSCLQALASVKSDPYRKFNEETVWDYSWVIPHGNAAMDAHWRFVFEHRMMPGRLGPPYNPVWVPPLMPLRMAIPWIRRDRTLCRNGRDIHHLWLLGSSLCRRSHQQGLLHVCWEQLSQIFLHLRKNITVTCLSLCSRIFSFWSSLLFLSMFTSLL